MPRRLTLSDHGELVIQELRTNGLAGVTITAPADLTGGSYAIELPDALPAGTEFLTITAAGKLGLSAGSTSSLDAAYDAGGAGLGAKITADAAVPVEIEVPAASGNSALLLDQDDNQKALDITKDGAGAGDAIAVLNAGTGRGLFIDQDGAGVGLDVDQDGGAIALRVNQAAAFAALDITAGAAAGVVIAQANNNRALQITKTGAGAGSALFLENDGTGNGVTIQQDGAGIALSLDQNGNGNALLIDAAAGSSSHVIDLTNNGTGRAVSITQVGNSICFLLNVLSSSTSDALRVTHAGNATALNVHKSGTGAGIAFDLENDGTGNGLFLDQDGNGIGLNIDSEATSANGANIDMVAGSTGNALFLDHNGNGIALNIDSEATSQPLIALLPIDSNSRGDIAAGGSTRVSDPSAPADGDIWYHTTASRWKARLSGNSVTFANLLGPAFGGAQIATIGTGAVSATTEETGVLVLAAESGTADDLDSILVTGSDEVLSGDTLILRADAGDTITVKHNTGNIHLDGSADKALVNGNQLMLIYNGTDWVQLTPMMVLP